MAILVPFSIILMEEVRSIFQDYPDVLTISQVAQALGIGRKAAYSLVHENKLGCVRVGKIIKVPKFCLEEYLQTARENVKL